MREYNVESIEAKYRADLEALSQYAIIVPLDKNDICLLYTSPSPRDGLLSRMPSSA